MSTGTMEAAGRRYAYAWLIDGIGIAVTGLLLLKPGSGFKSGLIWVGVLGMVWTARRRWAFRPSGVGFALVLFLSVMLLASVHSIDARFSYRQWFKLLEHVMGCVVLAVALRPPGHLIRGIQWLASAFGTILVWDGLRLAVGGFRGTLVLRDGRWFDSVLGYPTIAAGMYAVGLVLLAASFALVPGRRLRWMVVAPLLVALPVLYVLQTRSVLPGLAAGMTMFLMVSPFTRRVRALMALLVVMGLAGLMLIPGPFRERIFSGGSDRAAIWNEASLSIDRAVKQEPAVWWLGFGYGHQMFEKVHGTLHWRERQTGRVHDHAHNMWMETRIQAGYAGVAAWVVLLLTVAVRVVRCLPERNAIEARFAVAGLVGAMIAMLVYAQFSLFFGYLPALVFWVLLGALLAGCNLRVARNAQSYYP